MQRGDEGGALPMGINKNIITSDSSKRKWDENEEGEIDTPPHKILWEVCGL